MYPRQFSSFVKEAIAVQQGRKDLPADYLMTKTAALVAFPSLKTASGVGDNVRHGIELAGLGILARPSIQGVRGKEMSETSKHLHEIGGLGVLAAPSAYDLGKAGLSKLRSWRGK